ncbi:acetyl-CoA carboxylase biotin carboxylase subunit [Fodinisporobacter ferrooxydans]|uniref:biotin carboxylase n=1 Tax=Fodinisporobacter ferrooxydans TaxID=2901836 RepID=A0ABY4CFK1_9BACL|nr:acetyl-CoA carboxylase biotin carboxylase subunit [Alicyclobacillaceae bacterium MYW30-H2]
MFEKILVANRGEIACRIMRTCKALDVRTVGIYSEADRNSLHVQMADAAHLVGPPPVAQSYLQMDRILEIAMQEQVQAIHPGYGLLSENPEFAKKCAQAGIVFIGPQADTIEQMGNKVNARMAMKHAGVPVVPGTLQPIADAETAVRFANEIGYPVMVKASAGGGGIGMQAVADDDSLRKAFAANTKRVQAYFGDGSMYLEKYLESTRHIEAQILADTHGNVLFLWERECSIQRRHQKILEEAPSTILTADQREQLRSMARNACSALGYVNAGTIECLLDPQGYLYFLEMNTRLQVEHPVTEEITGLDLVAWQLRIANGEALTIKDEDISVSKHAIECRIYAERPDTFLPSPGTITSFKRPAAPWIRHELAVESGMTVTPFYDPMIAKLIVTGDTRNQAIERLQHALHAYQIAGIHTNVPFLQTLVIHPEFQKGNTTTDFIQRHMKQ